MKNHEFHLKYLKLGKIAFNVSERVIIALSGPLKDRLAFSGSNIRRAYQKGQFYSSTFSVTESSIK